jgi:anti-anti-sigma factor
VAAAFRPDQVLELAFAVGSEEQDDAANVWLSGEFDLAGIPAFAQEVERLERTGCDVAVFDLEQLLFIDAGALHAVLAARERTGDGRPPPALVGASRGVSRVFEVVGLERHLLDRG